MRTTLKKEMAVEHELNGNGHTLSPAPRPHPHDADTGGPRRSRLRFVGEITFSLFALVIVALGLRGPLSSLPSTSIEKLE